jgi:pimeloyl-ACP methyl ester carboxylesterase
VILNAGIIHRVGPNRMHVELARGLAAVGYTCLRFDLSGIGDSGKRNDGLSPLESSLADVREAIDWLQATRGTRKVILAGLCSGADHSLLCAGSDARVVGVVLLDPSIPRTTGHYIRYFGGRVLQARYWKDFGGAAAKVLARVVRLRAVAPAEPEATGRLPLDSPEVRSYLRAAYQRALARDVALLAVFTGDRDFLYNYRNQMLDAFRGLAFEGRLQLEFFASCDHTFCSEYERSRLIALVAKWVQSLPSAPAEIRPAHPPEAATQVELL